MLLILVACCFAEGEERSSRLGILLDTSPEMGFLVPQVRKEIRILNEQLSAAGSVKVEMEEMSGSGLDKEGSFAVGASRNNLYAFKRLFEVKEVDTVYWITSLRGMQTPAGLAGLESLLREGGTKRKLILRNVWQEQLVAGSRWVDQPPPSDQDRLAPKSRPGDWYKLLESTDGLVIRSWQTPPLAHQSRFGFPFIVRSRGIAQKMQVASGYLQFDTSWAGRLESRHGLKWLEEDEEWQPAFSGRRWVYGATLLPFPDSETKQARADSVYEALCKRPSIEEDLKEIPGEKVGALFSFGFVGTEIVKFKEFQSRGLPGYVPGYFEDLDKLADETRQFSMTITNANRVCLNRMVELLHRVRPPKGPDPHVAGLAELITKHDVDAIYWFTNGYYGEGEYGKFGVDLELLSKGILESGVKLFVRIPFEMGIAPVALEKLARESGGALLSGNPDDPDWRFQAVRD